MQSYGPLTDVQCLRMVPVKCETQIVLFNARCAGALLVFCCFQSLAVTLVSPLRVIRNLLNYDVPALRRERNFVGTSVVFGNVASGSVLLVMPLYGFYLSLGALSCKEHAPRYHLLTVILSCVDSFFTCAIFWVLGRGAKYYSQQSAWKGEYNKIKQNLVHKNREQEMS